MVDLMLTSGAVAVGVEEGVLIVVVELIEVEDVVVELIVPVPVPVLLPLPIAVVIGPFSM